MKEGSGTAWNERFSSKATNGPNVFVPIDSNMLPAGKYSPQTPLQWKRMECYHVQCHSVAVQMYTHLQRRAFRQETWHLDSGNGSGSAILRPEIRKQRTNNDNDVCLLCKYQYCVSNYAIDCESLQNFIILWGPQQISISPNL